MQSKCFAIALFAAGAAAAGTNYAGDGAAITGKAEKDAGSRMWFEFDESDKVAMANYQGTYTLSQDGA